MTKIPLKNYLYLLLTVIFTVFIIYYLYLWYVEYNSNLENKSVLVDCMQIINSNELDTYLVENKDAIIYTSVTNDNKIRRFERKLKKFIDGNNIVNKILYLDLTNNDKNTKYKVTGVEVNVPSFVVYKNGNYVDSYDISQNNFDLEQIKQYLIDNGVVGYD